ncbi:hypothetical protein TRSC58_07359 [Trypanosoma rangeli SC58]|uniref:Uncharacterized protein n=1 Tax=Trypanosoma rangeli SC58 TaxID=429131 RepID=A0A061ISY9_TRYRA|nr:hypothetical protein TRSC58_07359 [Trypanosoma rangeli SC58]
MESHRLPPRRPQADAGRIRATPSYGPQWMNPTRRATWGRPPAVETPPPSASTPPWREAGCGCWNKSAESQRQQNQTKPNQQQKLRQSWFKPADDDTRRDVSPVGRHLSTPSPPPRHSFNRRFFFLLAYSGLQREREVTVRRCTTGLLTGAAVTTRQRKAGGKSTQQSTVPSHKKAKEGGGGEHSPRKNGVSCTHTCQSQRRRAFRRRVARSTYPHTDVRVCLDIYIWREGEM